MNAIIIGNLIRICLEVALIYGIYTETGVWTTVFAVLITIRTEVSGFLLAPVVRHVLKGGKG